MQETLHYPVSQKIANDMLGASTPARGRRSRSKCVCVCVHFKQKCDTKETKFSASSLTLSAMGWSILLLLGIKLFKLSKQACYSKASVLYLNGMLTWYSSSNLLCGNLQSARLKWTTLNLHSTNQKPSKARTPQYAVITSDKLQNSGDETWIRAEYHPFLFWAQIPGFLGRTARAV